MKTPPEQFEFPLTLRVPASAFTVIAPEPATVTQHTAAQHFGIPARTYKQMMRDGLFPAKRIGRLIFASYNDVRQAVTEGAVAQRRMRSAIASSEKHPEETPMSVAAALSYVASARTPAERRVREQEIQRLAFDLSSKYGETLDNGSSNPRYDARLSKHADELLAVSLGAIRTSKSVHAAQQRTGGYYRQCCWCEREAFAVKQTWMDTYWSGGPVCLRCAERRGPKERIVDLETQTIIHAPKDPSVPTGWYASKRGRRRSKD